MSARPDSTAAPFDVLVLLPSPSGLEALSAVLGELPTDSPAAVLIGSSLGGEVSPVEFLGGHTPLPVQWAGDGTALQPGHVYVSPPHLILEVRPGGRCAVTPPEGELSRERPLDRLLASLAVSFGSRVLAVIMAGSGHDGVTGVRALRGVGGTILVQDPATADPAELPQAVIEAGAADLALSPQDLGRSVSELLAGQSFPQPPRETTTEGTRAGKALRESKGQGFLLELSDALRLLADPVAVQGEACRLLAERLDVDRAYYVEVDEAAGVAQVARDWVRGGAPSLAGQHRVADFGWSVAILRRGECHVIADTQTSDLVPPEARPASAALGIIACMGTPLIKEGRLVGALCVTDTRPRVWQESEVELLREVGERIWAAVEHAKAEEELRESRERLRFALEAANIGTWNLDLTTGQATRTFLHDQCFGATEPFSDWSYERFLSFVHPEDRAEVERKFGAALGQIKEWHFECRVVWADRSVHWIEARGSVYRTVSGEPARMLGIVSDITERKQREQQQEFLLRLSDALRPLSDAVEVQRVATRVIGEYLGVDRAYYVDIEPDHEHWVVADNYVREGAPPLIGRGRVEDFGWAGQELFAGRMLRISDVDQDPNLSESARAEFRAVDVAALLAIPLVKEGRWGASFAVQHLTPREWSEAETNLLQETAERTWAAVERAKAEQALRESEANYRTLFDTMAEGLTVCGVVRDAAGQVVDLRYLELNRGLEQQTGMDRRTIIGRKLSEVLPRADLERWLTIYTAVISSGEPKTFEEYVELLDRWFAVSVYPRAGDELASFYHDITERKRAEEASREAQERQAFLLMFSDALRAEQGADAVANRAIRMLSEQMGLDRCYITVYRLADDRADFPYQVGNDSVPALPDTIRLSDFPDAFRQVLTKTFVLEDDFERQGLSEAERRNSRGLGMRAMLASTIRKGENNPLSSMVAVSGTPRRWTPGEIALVEEVAERTWAALERARAEEALQALNAALEERVEERTRELEEERRRLEAANEELVAFTYSVSHDLRTPVRHVTSFVQLLRQSLGENVNAKTARYLTVIEEAAERMNTLIDGVLQVSRTSRLALRRESVDLEALVAAIRRELEVKVQGRQVVWEVAPLPVVIGDAATLRTVLTNLLDNALKFARTRELARLQVWAEAREGEWAVFVRDNGVGFDPRYADRLFGIFQRLHRTDEFEGAGVGLANVRRIIVRHGGRVMAAGQLEQGATFGFTLPRQRGSAGHGQTAQQDVGVLEQNR